MDNIVSLHQTQPTILSSLDKMKKNLHATINCHNIGRILEFDPNTQTCMVELMQIKQFNNQSITPAPITDVPIIMLGAGGGFVTMPNPIGTICLLLFMDRDITNFLETGEAYTPETTRMHDFTDCVALTTFSTLANPLTEYDENAVTIMREEIIEKVKYKSLIKLYSQQILIQNSLGGQISVTNKINIQNTTQNLATLIQSFLTACENISTINGGGLTPDSLQAFTNLKTQFEELLQ